MELFVEAGNYAAYQRACASRYGQMDGLSSYPMNPLMMAGAGHPIMQPSNLESYYQQILHGGMNGMPPNMFAGPHRPMPIVPQIPGAGFLSMNTPNNLYIPSSRLSSASPQQRVISPEQSRSHSLSPEVKFEPTSNLPSHSPNTSKFWPTKLKSSASDDESDIEV